MASKRFQQFKQHVSRPEFISGIYNYCDRWCERCEFSDRCSVFALEKRSRPGSHDPGPQFSPDDLHSGRSENQMFGELMGEALEAALDFLRESAEERGIEFDLDLDPEELEESAAWAMELKERADAHPVVSAAREYCFAVERWFGVHEGTLVVDITGRGDFHSEEELRRYAEREAASVGFSIETVRRYHILITSKLFRAISQQIDGIHSDDPEEETGGDAEGSAKVALIAIDRSFAAWYKLLDGFPECERDILDFLLQLDRLRRMVEMHVPDARAFIRPGFDDTTN